MGKVRLNILMMGKTGQGKSDTGNAILNRKYFKASSNLHSETKEVTCCFAQRESHILLIVDGPGLEDTAMNKVQDTESAAINMDKALALSYGGIDAFLLVTKFGNRFTAEDRMTLETLKGLFGPTYLDHVIVVMTCGDVFQSAMEEDGCSIGFHDWCKKQTEIRELYKNCKGRFVLINNREKDETKKAVQVQEILQITHELQKCNGRYTSQCFKAAEASREKLILEQKAPELTREIQEKISLLTAEIEAYSEHQPDGAKEKIIKRVKTLRKEIEIQDKNFGVLQHMLQRLQIIEDELVTLIKKQAQKGRKEQAKKAMEEQAKKDMEEQAKKVMEEQAKKDMEEQAKKDMEEQARKVMEEQAKKAMEEQAKKDMEEQARKVMKEQAKKAMEEQAKKVMKEQAKNVMKEQAKKAMEEQAKKDMEEQAKKDMEEQARKVMEEQARKVMKEQAKKAREEQAKKDMEEQARKVMKEQAKKAREEQAKKDMKEQAKKDMEEQARKVMKEQAKKAMEEQAKKDMKEHAKKVIEEQAQKARLQSLAKELEETRRSNSSWGFFGKVCAGFAVAVAAPVAAIAVAGSAAVVAGGAAVVAGGAAVAAGITYLASDS